MKNNLVGFWKFKAKAGYFMLESNYATEIPIQRLIRHIILRIKKHGYSGHDCAVASGLWRGSGRAFTVIKRCFPHHIFLLPAEMLFPLHAMDREQGATGTWLNDTTIRFQL
jgi:hypothetical protein